MCKVCRAVWPLLALTLVANCGSVAEVPVGEAGYPFNRETLSSLVGSTNEEVFHQLGPHSSELEGGGKAYFIYLGRGQADTIGVIVVGIVPILFPYPQEKEEYICLVLEFGSDQRAKRYDIQISTKKRPWGCDDLFFSQSELDELERVSPHFRPSVKSFCLTAHQGNFRSQVEMGNIYRWSRGSITADPVRAALWYSLSGDVGKWRMVTLVSTMTPEQNAEAERLITEWEPNPAECDEVAAQAER